MGLAQQYQNYDALDIINAIEKASANELAILSDIHRAISAGKTGANLSQEQRLEKSNKGILNAILSRQKSGNDNQFRDKRIYSQDRRIITASKSNHVQSISEHGNRRNVNNQSKSRNNQQNAITSSLRNSSLNAKAVKHADQSMQNSDSAENDDVVRQLENIDNHLKESRKKSDNSQKHDNSTKKTAPERGADGRFLSKTKSEEESARKDKSDSKSLLKRLSEMFTGSRGGMDTATDVAGSAAGGVFWQAGKELYDVGKGVKDNVVSLSEWGKKNTDGTAAVSDQPIRLPDAGKPKGAGSQAAYESSRSNSVISVVQEQNQTLTEGNKAIIESLKKIEENTAKHGGAAGGGFLSKLLGGAGLAGIGKMIGGRIIAGLTAVLGGKTIAGLLKRALGMGGGGAGGSLSDASIGDSAPGRGKGKGTKTPKTKEPKVKKPKGKLLKTVLNNGGKVATAAGATAAAAYAGAKALLSGADVAEDVAGALPDKTAKPDAEKKPGGPEGEKNKPTEAKGKEAAPKAETKAAGEAEEQAAKGAAKTVAEGADATAGTKAGETVAQKTEGEAAKGAGAAAQKTETAVAEKGAEKLEQKAGVEVAEKAGFKMAAKGALKALPLVGTAISAGMDAVDGYSDTDAQKKIFNVGENQDVTGRQKVEYSAANVIDMGGLVSGGAGLLASGARWLGMDKTADALTFDTGDIAKGLDSGLTAVSDMFSTGSTKEVDAIKEGTAKIVEAIGKVDKSIQDAGKAPGATPAEGGAAEGQATATTPPAPTQVTQPTTPLVAAPTVSSVPEASTPIPGVTRINTGPKLNSVRDDLNIGGSNANNRTFRNNNFGNLKFVGQAGATLEKANAKGEQVFAKFDSPEEGLRAAANQLSSYADGTSKAAGYKKLNTVQDIITKYAPESENNTSKYIKDLSGKLGVAPDQALDFNNPDVMTKTLRSIATLEGGNPQVSDDFIKKSIGNRSGIAGKWKGEFNPETLAKINNLRAAKGLEPIKNTDQHAAPERQSLTDKVLEGAKEMGGAAFDYTTTNLAELRDWSDEKLSSVFGNVEGMHIKAPDKGLTLPKGDKLPAGLASAALNPDEIGRSAKAISEASDAAITPSSIVGPARAAKSASEMPATSVSDTSWLDATLNSMRSIGGGVVDLGKGAISDMGVDLDNPMKWLSGEAGGGMSSTVSSLIQGSMQNTPLSFLSDTVASALGNKSGQLTQEALTSFSSTPTPPVTDLASSGVAPVMQLDNESRKVDEKQTDLLAKILETLKTDTGKKDANPNRTTETAQPAPRKDIPISVGDSSLERLFS